MILYGIRLSVHNRKEKSSWLTCQHNPPVNKVTTKVPLTLPALSGRKGFSLWCGTTDLTLVLRLLGLKHQFLPNAWLWSGSLNVQHDIVLQYLRQIIAHQLVNCTRMSYKLGAAFRSSLHVELYLKIDFSTVNMPDNMHKTNVSRNRNY